MLLARPGWLVPALVGFLLAGFAAGLWGSYRSAFPGRGLYRVSGVFQRRAGDLMIIKHDAVAGLMGEMSAMAVYAESEGLLDRARLEPGDRVRLTVRQAAPDTVVAVEIRKMP
jgi:hypothetical protein